jgi:negative regulator of genetic competence, sporulation and motility
MEMEAKEEVPVESFAVTGPIVIKGVAYDAGDTVVLTEEEHAALVEAGIPIEGVEPKDEDQIQADHEAGVEAQKARIEEIAEAEKKAEEEAKEAKAKAKAKV